MAGYDTTGKITVVVTWSSPVQAEGTAPTQDGSISQVTILPRHFQGKILSAKLKHMQVLIANDNELIDLSPYYGWHPYTCLLLRMNDFLETEVMCSPCYNPSDCFPVPLVPRTLSTDSQVYFGGNDYHYWLSTPDGLELNIPVKRKRSTDHLKFQLLQPAYQNNSGQFQSAQRAFGIQWAALWLEITISPDVTSTIPTVPYY